MIGNNFLSFFRFVSDFITYLYSYHGKVLENHCLGFNVMSVLFFNLLNMSANKIDPENPSKNPTCLTKKKKSTLV